MMREERREAGEMAENVELQDRFFPVELKEVWAALNAGYVFDPWLCSKGYPILTGHMEFPCYWVLINPKILDNPELIAKINPFKPLPVEPVAEVPAGYGTVFIPHQEGVDATASWAAKGYVLLHKDHVTSKGTILTLTKKPEEVTVTGAFRDKRPVEAEPDAR